MFTAPFRQLLGHILESIKHGINLSLIISKEKQIMNRPRKGEQDRRNQSKFAIYAVVSRMSHLCNQFPPFFNLMGC